MLAVEEIEIPEPALQEPEQQRREDRGGRGRRQVEEAPGGLNAQQHAGKRESRREGGGDGGHEAGRHSRRSRRGREHSSQRRPVARRQEIEPPYRPLCMPEHGRGRREGGRADDAAAQHLGPRVPAHARGEPAGKIGDATARPSRGLSSSLP